MTLLVGITISGTDRASGSDSGSDSDSDSGSDSGSDCDSNSLLLSYPLTL